MIYRINLIIQVNQIKIKNNNRNIIIITKRKKQKQKAKLNKIRLLLMPIKSFKIKNHKMCLLLSNSNLIPEQGIGMRNNITNKSSNNQINRISN